MLGLIYKGKTTYKNTYTFIFGSSTLNSQPIALEHMPGRSVSNTDFLCLEQYSLLEPMHTRQHFNTMLEGHFRQQKHQNARKHGTKYTTKRTLVYSMHAGTWSRELPSLTSDANGHIMQLKVFAALHMSVNDSKSALGTDFRFTNKFFLSRWSCKYRFHR